MTFFGTLLLAGLALLTISLQRTYGSVPIKELKRRARGGDTAAAALHRAASYGTSLRALLWVMIILFAALFSVQVAEQTADWFAVVATGLLLWTGFVWLPAQEATRIGVWIAGTIAPVFERILQYIHPIINKIAGFLGKHRPVIVHTGLYSKDDLLELFARQKIQSDNQVDEQALELAQHSLQFADKKVADILIPRRVVKSVAASDTIGPVVMTDLHNSGFSRFPVYEGKQDNIVGVLYLRDLVRAKTGGTVQKLMSKQVCYIHEEQPLSEALQAILQTHQQLFVVVNGFEEYVGIVIIEDIMEEIVGKQIVDEFDQYDDLRAVAAKMANKEHEEHKKDEEYPHENIQDATEVVE